MEINILMRKQLYSMSKQTIPTYPLPIGTIKPEHYGFRIEVKELQYDVWYRFKFSGTLWVYRKNSDGTISIGDVTLWDRFICWLIDRLKR